MRYQSGPGFCGAAAIVNALRCYGVRVREDVAARHAGTTKEHGTQEHGVKQSLERLGFAHSEINERRYANAEGLLLASITRGHPVIILAEEGEHWVTAVGMIGPRVIVADPQNYKWNHSENGVHLFEIGDSLRRFWRPYQMKRYGIVVKPK